MTPRPMPTLPPQLSDGLARHHGADYRDRVRSGLAEAGSALARPTTTVVFGGHFSAGKSSMLNLLIGRPLLPVSDFPETGVACVIRRGDIDRITAVRGTAAAAELPCTTEAIAEAVTLLAPDGAYRQAVRGGPAQVVIELADAPLPPGARWTDSPGINDLPEMTERASAAAARADVLVWVVNSRQPLSTVEEDFLHEYRERHGQDSVAVLVNVFLTEDVPEQWQRFLDTRAELHRRRLEQALGGRLPAELSFVSARAAAADPSHYGGPEARALVARITDRSSTLIRANRRHRAAGTLRALAEDAALRVREERARLHARQAETRLALAELAVAADRFRAAVDTELDRSLERWKTRTRECADRIGARIDTGPVTRDGDYGRELTALLRTASDENVAVVSSAVSRHAVRTGHRPLDASACAALATVLRPADAVVEIPGRLAGRLPELRTEGLGGAVSRGIGSLVPSLSGKTLRAIDSAVTSAAGTVQRARTAAETAVPDRERTRANLLEAADAAAREGAGRRQAVLNLILEQCRPVTRPPAEPDPAPLAVLDELHDLLVRFLAEVQDTAPDGQAR